MNEDDNLLKDLDHLSLSINLKHNKENYRRKCAILWFHEKPYGAMRPLCYLRKPKMVSEEDFQEFLNRIEIAILPKSGVNKTE